MTHPAPSLRATLRCHVATPSRVKLSVTADVQAQADALRLRYTLRGDTRLLLSAHTAVAPFYEKLGFVATGQPYDEAGLMHVDMTRNA